MNHPAKFSPPIIDAMWKVIGAEVGHQFGYPPSREHRPLRILDPFAGVGTVHQFRTLWTETWGVEIEYEWARESVGSMVGDATRLPFRAGWFDLVVTSPCYGNRLADTYDGKGVCRNCKGFGGVDGEVCPRCEGGGHDRSSRLTYRTALDQMPNPRSAASMQFGNEYRDLHYRAWRECKRVMAVGGLIVVNVSNHIRKGEEVRVAEWHQRVLRVCGFKIEQVIPVTTRRYKKGRNHEARVLTESVIVGRAQ